MVGRTAGVIAAASALTAQAFLIPPGVQSIDETVELTIVNTDWQTVKLPCPDCVLPTPQSDIKETTEDDSPMFIQGGANSLLVNITTLFGGNAIGLEGYPLYPPLASVNKPTVDIIPSGASLLELQTTSDRRHSVQVSASKSFVSEETVAPGDAVIQVKYQIMSVDNHPVHVDAIEITCIKNADNKMAILSVEPVKGSSSIFDSLTQPGLEAGKDKSSTSKKPCALPVAVCEWRDFVSDKISEMSSSVPKKLGGRPGCQGRKGKGKHLPSHIRPDFHRVDGETHRPGGHHGKPDMRHGRPHRRPQHGFPHHHYHHHAFHSIVKGFLMVLVPILLGITMGMAVSLVGMLVGRLVAFVWLRFVRGGRRGYASVQLNEEEAENAEAEKDEAESVIEEDLPRYEEAPQYEEKERV